MRELLDRFDRHVLPPRYSTTNVRRALADPRLLRGELTQLGTEANVAVHRRFRRHAGCRVMDEDWDALVILDACRYDMYRARRFDPDRLESRVSAGSESWEFMRQNFAGRQLHDTVYVTANPHAYKLDDGVFHHVRNLLDDEWDPDRQTVVPSAVADAARAARERFGDKRLVVHFMQPHFPFLGPTGRDLDDGGIVYHLDDAGDARGTGTGDDARDTGTGDDARGTGTGDDADRTGADRAGNGAGPADGLTVWGKLRYGLLDRDAVWRAFCENLDIVLDEVDSLLSDLSGRTVVTADHGNLVGERLFPVPTRGYGHPPGLRAPALVTVPWHVIDDGDRPTIRSEPPVEGERDRLDDGVAEQRLRALGYRE